MDKIIEYEILVEDLEQLGMEVKEKIKEGWQPLGTPFSGGSPDFYIAQAVVKYE